MTFHPYLYFDGTCREAFTFYQQVFGGELVVMDGTEAPPDAGIPEDKRDLVMHAALMNGDELLMASDSYDDEFTPMNGSYVHYSTDDLDRAKSIFDSLCDGGEIQVPGRSEFWTPFWGMCRDRFGINWQISVEQEPPAS